MDTWVFEDEMNVYNVPNHYSDGFKELSKLYEDGEFCDVLLKAGDRTFNAHKIVLIICCPYFSAMFRSGMMESLHGAVKLRGVDPDALDAVLKMFYTGSITLKESTVQSLLSTATLFQLDHLKAVCCDYLHRQLSPNNCLGIRTFAETHSCTDLATLAHRHAMARFTEVVHENEFLSLSLEQVESLCQSNKLSGMYACTLIIDSHALEHTMHLILEGLVTLGYMYVHVYVRVYQLLNCMITVWDKQPLMAVLSLLLEPSPTQSLLQLGNRLSMFI